MPEYMGTVCVTYYQDIIVRANNEEEAELKMCESFDIGKAGSDSCKVYDLCKVEVYSLEENHD